MWLGSQSLGSSLWKLPAPFQEAVVLGLDSGRESGLNGKKAILGLIGTSDKKASGKGRLVGCRLRTSCLSLRGV